MDAKSVSRHVGAVSRSLRTSLKAPRSSQSHQRIPTPRTFTSTPRARSVQISPAEELTSDAIDVPRWRQTPTSMKMPFQVRRPAIPTPFLCNEDPQKLHEFYDRLLGTDGWKVLSEDTRWLAVTHKSFDQGRRGFNARLSYLGRRIVELQYSLSVLSKPAPNAKPAMDGIRTPFLDPKYAGLNNLNAVEQANFLSVPRLASIASKYGMAGVIRWKPRDPKDLQRSGKPAVMAQALYAIIGAIALERGGPDADRVVQRRILES